MTYEGALGRPIQDLDDAMMAVAGFGFAKHGWEQSGHDTWHDATQAKINEMNNVELMQHLSLAMTVLQEAKTDDRAKLAKEIEEFWDTYPSYEDAGAWFSKNSSRLILALQGDPA